MTATKFSIVVPAYNVRAYLRECLDSLLAQSYADFELIAVDDCSPDGSGEILDEYAALDSRVRVLHLPKNVGLGPARDAGIEVATGEYLMFVDSDDTLTPGALQAIADRLDETAGPDVLIFDYARTYWNNRVARNKLAPLLGDEGPEVFRIDERPELLRLLMIVWNKVYRRDFVERHGFRFPPGYYEDTPWTYPTLLAAERIAVLDRVCIHYRQRRHGNILRSRSRKHFDIFAQYERVFAFLDRHPELDGWRTFIFGRNANHCLHILTSPQRLPPSAREEFFHRASAHYRRFVPAGYTPPSGGKGLEIKAVARDDYRAFRALRVAAGAKRATRSRLGRTRTTTRRHLNGLKHRGMRAFYRAQLRRPLDEKLAVYAAYWYRGYSCNPAAIYEKARELAPDVRGVWVVSPQYVGTVPEGVDYVLPGSRRYYQVLARATYFVNNTNFPNHLVKRPGQVHVQTQHGVPLKKMGIELQANPVGAAGMDFDRLLERCDRWDYLLSSNRFSTEVWERSYPSDYETLETGYPRTDRLVRADGSEYAHLRERLGIGPSTKAVLYAPTFRDWRYGFEPEFDLAQFCDRLGHDYVLLVRAHYFLRASARLAGLVEQGRVKDVSAYPSIEDLMIASDVLLTDYSSVMFDYAVLDRPVVVYANDWDTYVRCRGVNFDLMEAAPGVVETTEEGLADAFVSGRAWGDAATRARQEFRKRFCESADGRASERLVRRVFLGEPVEHTVRATSISQETPHGDAPDDDPDDERTAPAADGQGDHVTEASEEQGEEEPV
ncbi:MAG: bifunctional glycosyltransferase/CDP-glycerol:glycerophosphate glycerophosphotransferase [Actinomycetes bacterium]